MGSGLNCILLNLAFNNKNASSRKVRKNELETLLKWSGLVWLTSQNVIFDIPECFSGRFDFSCGTNKRTKVFQEVLQNVTHQVYNNRLMIDQL